MRRQRYDRFVPRTLGVSCSPTGAFLALLVDGVVQQVPDRLPWPVGEASERLAVAQDEIADLLNEFGVERVAALLPERDPRYKWLYETVEYRCLNELADHVTNYVDLLEDMGYRTHRPVEATRAGRSHLTGAAGQGRHEPLDAR